MLGQSLYQRVRPRFGKAHVLPVPGQLSRAPLDSVLRVGEGGDSAANLGALVQVPAACGVAGWIGAPQRVCLGVGVSGAGAVVRATCQRGLGMAVPFGRARMAPQRPLAAPLRQRDKGRKQPAIRHGPVRNYVDGQSWWQRETARRLAVAKSR